MRKLIKITVFTIMLAVSGICLIQVNNILSKQLNANIISAEGEVVYTLDANNFTYLYHKDDKKLELRSSSGGNILLNLSSLDNMEQYLANFFVNSGSNQLLIARPTCQNIIVGINPELVFLDCRG